MARLKTPPLVCSTKPETPAGTVSHPLKVPTNGWPPGTEVPGVPEGRVNELLIRLCRATAPEAWVALAYQAVASPSMPSS